VFSIRYQCVKGLQWGRVGRRVQSLSPWGQWILRYARPWVDGKMKKQKYFYGSSKRGESLQWIATVGAGLIQEYKASLWKTEVNVKGLASCLWELPILPLGNEDWGRKLSLCQWVALLMPEFQEQKAFSSC
jgi:hypothetical protein